MEIILLCGYTPFTVFAFFLLFGSSLFTIYICFLVYWLTLSHEQKGACSILQMSFVKGFFNSLCSCMD